MICGSYMLSREAPQSTVVNPHRYEVAHIPRRFSPKIALTTTIYLVRSTADPAVLNTNVTKLESHMYIPCRSVSHCYEFKYRFLSMLNPTYLVRDKHSDHRVTS